MMKSQKINVIQIVWSFVFAVLMEVRVIPPGQPLFIPPSLCPTSMQAWDHTGDGTVDELRFVMEEKCNLKHEEMLKNKNKNTKTISYDL